MKWLNQIKNKYSHIYSKTYPDPVINKDCSEFEVNNWIVSDFIIQELVPVVGINPFPINEQLLLTAAFCRFKPTTVFEWGTNIGKSARIFYEISKHFEIPCIIHSIDLPDDLDHIEHPHSNRGRFVKGLHNVILHQGDGVSTSLEIIKKTDIKSDVLFFLDGDHSYSSISSELNAIIEQVQNPVILIHDTFYQSSKSGYNIGPFLAIKKILTENENLYTEISTNTGLPGLTLLFKNNRNYIYI